MIWRLIQFVVVLGGLGLLFAGIKWTTYSGDFGNGLVVGTGIGFGWFYLLYWIDKRTGYVIELTEAQRNERPSASGYACKDICH